MSTSFTVHVLPWGTVIPGEAVPMSIAGGLLGVLGDRYEDARLGGADETERALQELPIDKVIMIIVEGPKE